MNKIISSILLVVFIFLTYYISSFLDGELGYGYMKFSVIFILIGGLVFYFFSKKDNSEKYKDMEVYSWITIEPKPVQNSFIINSFVISSSIYFLFILLWRILCSLFEPSFILDISNNGLGWIISLFFVWYSSSFIGSYVWGCSKGKVFRITRIYSFITISWMFGLYGYFGKFLGF